MDLKKHAETLRPALDEASKEEAELQGRLDEVRENRRRIQRAIQALAPSPRKPPKRAAQWNPSDEMKATVQAFVESHPDGVTVADVTEGAGVSKTAADRTLRILRDDAIRLAGKRGTALVYKPMPSSKGGMNGA